MTHSLIVPAPIAVVFGHEDEDPRITQQMIACGGVIGSRRSERGYSGKGTMDRRMGEGEVEVGIVGRSKGATRSS
jgi:hypothetical protein